MKTNIWIISTADYEFLSTILEKDLDVEGSKHATQRKTGSTSGSNAESAEFEDCAIAYFAGKVCYKLLGKFHCKYCENNILRKNGRLDFKQHLFILHKYI